MSLEEEILKFRKRSRRFIDPEISLETLEKDCRAYEEDSAWDSVYRIASTLVEEGWGSPRNPQKVVDGLIVLLRIWNQQVYGPYSFHETVLKRWIECAWARIDGFRRRDILSLRGEDHDAIDLTFSQLLPILRKSGGKEKASPVSVAKALHMLAPAFFPMWDYEIAHGSPRSSGWKCPYETFPAIAYIVFCERIQKFAAQLNAKLSAGHWLLAEKTLLKRIDEYNFMNR